MAKGHAISVRLQDELRERLKESAAFSGRTMSQEIQERLSASFEAAIDLQTIATMVQDNQVIAKAVATEISSTHSELKDLKGSTVRILEKVLDGELRVTG